MQKKRMRKAGTGLFLVTVFLAAAGLSVNAKEMQPEQIVTVQEEIVPVEVYDLEAKNGTEVPCVKLTAPGLKPPVEGAAVSSCTPAEVKPSPGQEGLYEVTRAYWTDYNPDKDQGSRRSTCRSVAGAFKPVRDENGEPVYRFFVEVRLKDAYQFPASHHSLGAVKFGDALVINETPVEFGQKYNLLNTWIVLGNHKGEAGLIQAFFEVRDKALTEIDGIFLTESGLTDPVPGKKAADMPAVSVAQVAAQNGMYDITDAFWVEHEYSATPFTGVFENGKNYYYYIKLKVRDGYCLSEKINATYADPWLFYINDELIGADGSRYRYKTISIDRVRGTMDAHVYLPRSETASGGDTSGSSGGGSSAGSGTGAGTGTGTSTGTSGSGGTVSSGGGSSSGNTSAAGTWKKAKNGKYWYDLGGGKYPKNEWKQISGKWYYFDKSGYMVTGWKQIKKKWYYFGGKKDGVMKTGWVKSGSKWYYMDKESGAMKTGWVKVSGKWYYMDKASGAMTTGWLKSGGKWYYLDGKGRMLVNTSRKIGKKTYKFNAKGVCTNG